MSPSVRSDQQSILKSATHGVVFGFIVGWLGVVAMQVLLLRSFRRDLVSALHCEPAQVRASSDARRSPHTTL